MHDFKYRGCNSKQEAIDWTAAEQKADESFRFYFEGMTEEGTYLVVYWYE